MEQFVHDLTRRNEVLVFHELSEVPTPGGYQTRWLLSHMDKCVCGKWKYDFKDVCVWCKED